MCLDSPTKKRPSAWQAYRAKDGNAEEFNDERTHKRLESSQDMVDVGRQRAVSTEEPEEEPLSCGPGGLQDRLKSEYIETNDQNPDDNCTEYSSIAKEEEEPSQYDQAQVRSQDTDHIVSGENTPEWYKWEMAHKTDCTLGPYVNTGSVQLERMITAAQLTCSDLLLDIGCGTGSLLAEICGKTGCRAQGIDINPGLIEQAGRSCNRKGLSQRLQFRCLAAEELDWAFIKESRFTVIYLYALYISKNIHLVKLLQQFFHDGGCIVTASFYLPEEKFGAPVVIFPDPDKDILDLIDHSCSAPVYVYMHSEFASGRFQENVGQRQAHAWAEAKRRQAQLDADAERRHRLKNPRLCIEDRPKLWKIVNSMDRRGVIVREGFQLASPRLDGRLSDGAIVKEIELVHHPVAGYRLHFEALTGNGPRDGWMSPMLTTDTLGLVQKVLAVRISEQVVDAEMKPKASRNVAGADAKFLSMSGKWYEFPSLLSPRAMLKYMAYDCRLQDLRRRETADFVEAQEDKSAPVDHNWVADGFFGVVSEPSGACT